MADAGVKVSLGTGGTRIELECEHQSGVLYTVPGEMSWVCTPDMLHAHALAGFLRELVKLDSPQVEAPDAALGRLLPGAPCRCHDG